MVMRKLILKRIEEIRKKEQGLPTNVIHFSVSTK